MGRPICGVVSSLTQTCTLLMAGSWISGLDVKVHVAFRFSSSLLYLIRLVRLDLTSRGLFSSRLLDLGVS